MKSSLQSLIFLLLFLFFSFVSADEKAGKPLYAPIKPKDSVVKNQGQLQATKDWDLLYRIVNKVSNSNFGTGFRRSLQSVSGIEVLGSLFYGLSMAAGLALGVSMADANIVSALSKRVDHRFNQRKNQLDKSVSKIMSSLGASKSDQKTLPSEPVIQKYVAPSKDGKDHYHHVVHYHVPYPLSVGALETARQNYPHISWYNSHNPKSPDQTVLSGYLGPVYKNNHANNNEHQPVLVGHNTVSAQVVSMPNMIELANSFVQEDQNLRRNDFHVYSDSEYFKNLNPKPTKSSSKTTNPPSTQQRSTHNMMVEASPSMASPTHHTRVNSFEDMFFEQHSHHKPIVQEVRQPQNQQHLPQLVTLEADNGLNNNQDHNMALQSEQSDVMDYSNYHPALTMEGFQPASPSSDNSMASTTAATFPV